MACLCLRTRRRSRRAGLAGVIQTFLMTRICWLMKPPEVGRGFRWPGVEGVRGRIRLPLVGLKEASGSLPKVAPQKMG